MIQDRAVLDLVWGGGETGGPSRVPTFQPPQCCDCRIHRSVLLQWWWCVPFSPQKFITTRSLSQGCVTLSPTQTVLYFPSLQQFAYLSLHRHYVTVQLQAMLCPRVQLPHTVPSQTLSSLTLLNRLMKPILPFGSLGSMLTPESCLGVVCLSASCPGTKLCEGLS